MHGSTLNNTSATSKRSVNWDAVQKNSTWKIKKAQWEEAKELAGKLNKRSFWYTGIWYTLWLVNFDRFCQHWSITDADEICNLSMSEAVFTSVVNNTQKDFLQCKWRVCKEQDCIIIIMIMIAWLWSMEDVFAIFPNGFELICQFFPRVMSSLNGKGNAVSTIMVVCLHVAHVAVMKDQVERVHKIRVAATAIGIDEEAVKNWRVRDCVKITFVTPVHLLSCFGKLTFCLVEFDTSDSPCSVYNLFKLLSIARYVLKSLSTGVQGTKFETFCEHVSK